jgi:hypothetical protein
MIYHPTSAIEIGEYIRGKAGNIVFLACAANLTAYPKFSLAHGKFRVKIAHADYNRLD